MLIYFVAVSTDVLSTVEELFADDPVDVLVVVVGLVVGVVDGVVVVVGLVVGVVDGLVVVVGLVGVGVVVAVVARTAVYEIGVVGVVPFGLTRKIQTHHGWVIPLAMIWTSMD